MDILKNLVGKKVKLSVSTREVLRPKGKTTIISSYSLDRQDLFTDQLVNALENSGIAYRVLLPGKAYTMEMNYTRTTITIDEQGVITQAGIN